VPQLIARFNDGSTLEFDEGRFDGWCVYLTRPSVSRYAPRDTEYFEFIRRLANKHGRDRLYGDFRRVYELTSNCVEEAALDAIRLASAAYGEDALEFSIMMVTIYAGMIAEENKKFSRLGRRVKRLGIYQVLYLGMPVESAANFSRGKPWRQIAKECQSHGF
jgi:hypothetical protein